mmetsp:Transcript_24525/g.61743  ORF Transcript_24525/g.61743 Transcript_24525/m.61743 type:complete len:228 (+) Transcript_24525:843-1526(+)
MHRCYALRCEVIHGAFQRVSVLLSSGWRDDGIHQSDRRVFEQPRQGAVLAALDDAAGWVGRVWREPRRSERCRVGHGAVHVPALQQRRPAACGLIDPRRAWHFAAPAVVVPATAQQPAIALCRCASHRRDELLHGGDGGQVQLAEGEAAAHEVHVRVHKSRRHKVALQIRHRAVPPAPGQLRAAAHRQDGTVTRHAERVRPRGLRIAGPDQRVGVQRAPVAVPVHRL